MSPSRMSAVGEPIGVELRWKASCAVMAIIVGGKTNSIFLSPFQKIVVRCLISQKSESLRCIHENVSSHEQKFEMHS